MSSETPPVETVQDIQVKLKPIFGVEPKHYLAGFYLLLALGLLFAVLVLPGITHPGTQVTVTSSPPGASVTWGLKHWGTTPVTVFFPQGTGPLIIEKPGFSPVHQEYVSQNQLFFSLFFPKSDSISVTLSPQSESSVSDRLRSEVGRWALAAPFTSDYRFPPLFTRFVEDAAQSGWDNKKIQSSLLELRSAVADPQMYQNYGQALGLWKSESLPDGLEAQFRLWEPLVGAGSGRLALWLLANQTKPVRDREVAEPSDWFKAKLGELTSSLKISTVAATPAPASLKTSQGSFRGVAPSTFLWGASGPNFSLPTDPPFSVPVLVTSPSFWIAEREVSQAEFATFVAAVPRWHPSNRDTLISEGQADADYLADWKDGKPQTPEAPVAAVSWYAAQAYADWLNTSGRVPAGKRFVLPDEIQWEAAARAPGGASMLNQGVWEWTASAWYPGQSLVWTNADQGRENLAYARSLKGGFQTTKGSVKASDRAGWPATGSTPGLGFRLALVGVP